MALDLKDLKVILVDDSRTFIAVLGGILANAGAAVDSFSSAAEAIAHLKNVSPDLIVTDLEMPEMDGYAFIEVLRKNPLYDQVPILVLTGLEATPVMVRAIELGADAFALKSSVKNTFLPQLMALARLRALSKKAAKAGQLVAVQGLIGTYKHEFGNILTIADGKFSKLLRDHSELENDASVEVIKKSFKRFNDTLKKLDELRSYEEETYVGSSKILKVG